MKCRGGIKTIYLREANSPQMGREITIYIVKIPEEFEESSFAADFGVGIADEHSGDFWIAMALKIEQILA